MEKMPGWMISIYRSLLRPNGVVDSAQYYRMARKWAIIRENGKVYKRREFRAESKFFPHLSLWDTEEVKIEIQDFIDDLSKDT